MEPNKCFEAIEVWCKFKSSPHAPTESNTKELFVPLFLKMLMQCLKSGLHFLPVLGFDVLHDGPGQIASVGSYKYLWQVDIVSPFGKSVCYILMPATCGSKNVWNYYEHSLVSFPHMIDVSVSKVEFLAFGMIISL